MLVSNQSTFREIMIFFLLFKTFVCLSINIFLLMLPYFSSYNDSSRSSLGNIGGLKDYGGGGSGVGGSLDNYNTYGLSVKFLEGLGINGPLHTKVFVANVSI